ncbi:MAG: hypothetical protein M1840_007856 [Geoglossum simile]|nr:MAG: hypothetical protein M1840_007856 [Geoglossum simile]
MLNESDVAYCYNHDVESFLYVLIWNCIYKFKPVQPTDITSTKPAKNTTSASTRSGSRNETTTARSYNDEITKAKPPPRRSARLASKSSPDLKGQFCTWELDRSHHTSKAKDPLLEWRREPRIAEMAKRSLMQVGKHWEALLGSFRPGFNSAPLIKMLAAIRDTLFTQTVSTPDGILVTRFVTPAQKMEQGEAFRSIDSEKKLFEDVRAIFLLAIEELQALESANL